MLNVRVFLSLFYSAGVLWKKQHRSRGTTLCFCRGGFSPPPGGGSPRGGAFFPREGGRAFLSSGAGGGFFCGLPFSGALARPLFGAGVFSPPLFFPAISGGGPAFSHRVAIEFRLLEGATPFLQTSGYPALFRLYLAGWPFWFPVFGVALPLEKGYWPLKFAFPLKGCQEQPPFGKFIAARSW